VQSREYGGKSIQSERIIHWRWNPVNSEAFGSGLLRTLLETFPTPGGVRMSFLEMKARIERMMPEIIEKYAGPDELWIFKGVSEDQLTSYQALIKPKLISRELDKITEFSHKIDEHFDPDWGYVYVVTVNTSAKRGS